MLELTDFAIESWDTLYRIATQARILNLNQTITITI